MRIKNADVFENSVIAMFTSFFITSVTRNLLKNDVFRDFLSDRQKTFKSPKWRKVMTKLQIFQKGQFLINNTVVSFGPTNRKIFKSLH